MNIEEIRILIYRTNRGVEPFNNWLHNLDSVSIERVLRRINRVRFGNFGDYKNIGNGIFELRLDFDGGYRIYFTMSNKKEIVILNGGNKKTQRQDIKKAIEYLEEYEK
ncbi:MAG: type II toxin-antitoxin system RelE/ParE family toxin [Rickettsiales bacterium]|nr:type II toxin-antitoxin system RelE/ParE family toxin [Rickettsiales bacterium]